MDSLISKLREPYEMYNRAMLKIMSYMENIKTYETLEEAFNDKPIWPDYSLQYDNYSAGVESYVRKVNDKGEWYLIPVRMTWEFADRGTDTVGITDELKQAKQLLTVVKLFTERCYRTLLFYIVPIDEAHITDIRGHTLEKLDSDQRSERERLSIWAKAGITKDDFNNE
jgi:hypothetical protein